ncbi:MAG: TMEM198/TM7SF3 family protein [Clostridia bacterium]|nr:TMEM198/TM7SF3 family protein [Clostridia bacterium]NCC42665.1 TMEM198/TM7SF3 family protein [Clostridia bacterium]
MEIYYEYVQLAQKAASMAAVWLVLKFLFGSLNCFMGYKLLKVWIAMGGFLIGAITGHVVTTRFTDTPGVIWGVTLAAGLILAVLAYEIYLVGAFLLGWVMTAIALFVFGNSLNISDKAKVGFLIAGVLIGIVVGILIVKFARPCIIAITAVSGAIGVSSGIVGLARLDNGLWMMLISIVFMAAGIFVQWRTTSHPKRKAED